MKSSEVYLGRRVTLNSGGPVCLIVDVDMDDPIYVMIAWRDGEVSQEDWFHVDCLKVESG